MIGLRTIRLIDNFPRLAVDGQRLIVVEEKRDFAGVQGGQAYVADLVDIHKSFGIARKRYAHKTSHNLAPELLGTRRPTFAFCRAAVSPPL
jgi:hypothetical protein